MDPDAIWGGEVGRGMGVLDGVGYHRRGRGSFGGEVDASHCNQWSFCNVALLKLLCGLVVINETSVIKEY